MERQGLRDFGLWDRVLGGTPVEEGLKDEGCGDLIDEAAVLLAGVAGFVEDLVGFAGG